MILVALLSTSDKCKTPTGSQPRPINKAKKLSKCICERPLIMQKSWLIHQIVIPTKCSSQPEKYVVHICTDRLGKKDMMDRPIFRRETWGEGAQSA